ncbi:MAG: hypothetical protein BM557_06270 [Flavobacterium sp. MedPE-SWcel]|uniref:pentapeptide repeat-containing protein n=1 Tax=uncultured Flavobacterium sp. TaxID=165435 RepID=UPI00091046C8|nr:pentapeptide repeat-containing protein [uncultured Flavobacterium sp.]OIQ19307.1 MAG: hypothetical protein BM557_06270 [Flavobacterium sp. MedPE-SWcel]
MNKKDYPKNHPDYILFYGEKNAENEWYTLGEYNKKIWDAQKVTDFWARLRKEKMANEDYIFSHFIFPEFGKDNFWVEGEEKVFTKNVTFFEATFSDAVDFKSTTFSGRGYFSYATFSGEVDFGGLEDFGVVTFESETDFRSSTSTTFSGKTSFIGAIFSGWVNFRNVTFESETDFSRATFEGWAYFEDAKFSGGAYFGNVTFSGKTDFGNVTFSGEAYFEDAKFIFIGTGGFPVKVDFSYAKFSGGAYFGSTTFSGEAHFKSATFSGLTHFLGAKFSDTADFRGATFSGELFFEGIYCIGNANLQFNNTKFPKEQIAHFKNIRFVPTTKEEVKKVDSETEEKVKPANTKSKPTENIPTIAFNRVIFTSQIIFLNCDFTYIQFTDCELTKATIGNCNFSRKQKMFRMPIGSNRILLGNEVFTKSVYKQVKEQNESEKNDTEEVINELNKNKKERELKIKPKPALKEKKKQELKQELKYEHYNMMAVTYRQLKTNRANNKDWATAGDAYRSEMVMRKQIIWHEIIHNWKILLIFNWLIIWLHDILSGFQQSISRPLLWLCAVWFGFGWGYYYFDDYSMSDGLKQSAKAILILSGSLDKGSLFGYMVLERVLGVILLTFFVLATRARLKQ